MSLTPRIILSLESLQKNWRQTTFFSNSGIWRKFLVNPHHSALKNSKLCLTSRTRTRFCLRDASRCSCHDDLRLLQLANLVYWHSVDIGRMTALYLLSQFREVLREYEILGHAECVPSSQLFLTSQSVYYLPVHEVTKEDSITTKLRGQSSTPQRSQGRVFRSMTLSCLDPTSILTSLRCFSISDNTRLPLRLMSQRCLERWYWMNQNVTFTAFL